MTMSHWLTLALAFVVGFILARKTGLLQGTI